MLLIGANEEDAVEKAREIQTQINEIVPGKGATELGITIGLTTLNQGGSYVDALRRANKNMMGAKREGKAEGKKNLIKADSGLLDRTSRPA